jgi:hypothetical protein
MGLRSDRFGCLYKTPFRYEVRQKTTGSEQFKRRLAQTTSLPAPINTKLGQKGDIDRGHRHAQGVAATRD